MVSYGIAKANRTDWNERTEITKAIITWVDKDYEYALMFLVSVLRIEV